MFRSRALLVTVLVLLLTISAGVAAAPPIVLLLNGKEVRSDVLPQIVNGRTLVPVRVISELLGAKVDWHDQTRTVSVRAANNTNLKKQAELLAGVVAPPTPLEAVSLWAEGALTCNGPLQYAAMSTELRKTMLPSMEQQEWVTGWPGGWAQRYEVRDETTGDTALRQYAVVFYGPSTNGGTTSEQIKLRARLSRRPDLSATWVIEEILVPKSSLVPFMQCTAGADPTGKPGQAFDWMAGSWDLTSGKIEVAQGLVARIRGPQLNIGWNGTSVVRLVPRTYEDLYNIDEVRGAHSVTTTQRPVYSGPLVSGWLADGAGEVLATAQLVMGQAGKSVDLKLYLTTQVNSVEFPLGSTKPTDLLRPVALYGTVNEPRILFQTSYADPNRGIRFGLIEGAKNERGVVWRTVSPDLGTHEAGAGTKMAKVGNFVYIGVQGGTLKKVDINTGAMSDVLSVNEAIKKFNALHGYQLEAASPPSISSFGDTAIISWEPLAVKTIQTSSGPGIEPVNVNLYLALQNDAVIAEIQNISGTVTTVKHGLVTGRVTHTQSIDRSFLFPNR